MKVKKIANPEYTEKQQQVASWKRVSVQCEAKSKKICTEIKALESELALTQRKIELKLMDAQELSHSFSAANDEWRSALEELKDIPKMIEA